MAKSSKVETILEAEEVLNETETEKDILLALYQELKDRNINSIGDLENLIARS